MRLATLRRLALVLLLLAGIALAGRATGSPPRTAIPTSSTADVDWHARYLELDHRHARLLRRSARIEHERNDLRRTLRHRPDVVEAIRLASVVYGVSPGWMLRRGSCESTGGHGHDPNARNPRSHASGEFQFLWPTWRSTPFASFSPFSPYANALAAGWMMGPAHRAGEWDCR